MYFFHQVAGQVYRLSRANLDGSNLTLSGMFRGGILAVLNIDHTNNKLYWYMLGAGGHTETGSGDQISILQTENTWSLLLQMLRWA
jgi:hypothetical protein